MNEPMKLCPFCGKPGGLYQDITLYTVLCNCQSHGPWHRTREGAIAAWNRRAPDPLLALVHELRTAALPFSTADDSTMTLAPVSSGEVKALALALARTDAALDNTPKAGEGEMLTLKQWVESRLASALRELDETKRRYRKLEEAARDIENGKDPSLRVRQAYADWTGLQPKDEPAEAKEEKK